jgi:hypothetical protein
MSNPKTNRPKHVLDHRSKQLDPQNPEYYRCRGLDVLQAQRVAERTQKLNLSVVKTTSHSPKPRHTK